jgi:hypothetical protein
MILSYSLDVKQLPLDILFFNFDVFILKLYIILVYDFFSLSYNPDLVAEFIPKHGTYGINGTFFIFFILCPYWIFVKRDKLLSKKIKFKYENIK